MAPTLAAQAATANTQGNQMLANDQSQASTAQGNYNTYSSQANAANQNVNDYTNYMAGAGSGTNLYNTALSGQEQQLGYDPNQMTAARGNLNQATGALSAYGDFANSAASKFGLNAGGFAAANSGALSGLNNNIAAQQGVVTGLSNIYGQAQTGANQSAGLGVQGEQNTLAGYQNTFQNATSQRDSAASMLQFFNQLASTQGGLNAQQQQYYAQAQQAMASANQEMAQVSYLASQTTGQNLTNQQSQAYMASPAYKSYLSTTPSGQKLNSNGQPIVAPTAAQLSAQNAAVQKATQNTANVSDASHGLDNMDLLSWLKNGL